MNNKINLIKNNIYMIILIIYQYKYIFRKKKLKKKRERERKKKPSNLSKSIDIKHIDAMQSI